jgi:hypothetical protein
MKVLWPALFRLQNFPHLKTLRFSFHSRYNLKECRRLGGAQPSPDFLVQKAVLSSIASDPYPSTVKNLFLTNVIGIEDNVYESPAPKTAAPAPQSPPVPTVAPTTAPLAISSFGIGTTTSGNTPSPHDFSFRPSPH